jgi:putative ABC transport system permease protein
MRSFTTHIRLALRTLAKRRGLFAGRALTVVLVVTAFNAVFTFANVTFLRPLPFPEPERLVRVYLQPPETTGFNDANPLYPIVFLHFRDRARAFERFEGIWAADPAVSGDGEPESVPGGRVSAGFFRLLGGTPVIGREFTEQEVEAGAKVVVLSHGFWLRRYGGDPSVLGRVLILDREPYTILGVLGPSFEPGFAPSELWTPLDIRQGAERLTLSSVQTIARLEPGVSAAQAVAELESLEPEVLARVPALLKGSSPGVVDLRQAQYGSQRPAILLLLAASIALALIAVANLGNLTLADVMFRRSDFAVRAALGGSRLDLAAPEIVQSLVVASVGGLGGVLGASWLTPMVLALDPGSALSAGDVPTDWRVVFGGFSVAVVVMLAAVAVPVFQLAGPALASDLAAGSRRAIGGGVARRTRAGLVVAQTALALVLLASGALVVSAFERAARVDPGFDPRRVVTAQIRLSATVLPADADRATFIDRVLERLRATPGVIAAGTTLNRFEPNNSFQTGVQIEDHPLPDGRGHTVQYRRVSPGYFETMRVPIVSGRDFSRDDWVGRQPVAIVSRGFARRFWADADPIGRRIKRGATSQAWSVVVGVVGDVRDVALDQAPRETVYSPYFQASNPAAPVALVVRTAADPRGAITAIKQAVWAIDPTQPLANIVTVEDFLGATLGPQRLRSMLVVVCGTLGLLLATIGTYGVTARSVVERRREVGIRLALGDTRLGVWRTIAWGSVSGVLVGSVAGAALSALTCATLVALLPDLHGTPWTFTAVAAGVLILVGTVAALAAARAASVVDPLIALRAD